jgi:hypothetical protein
LLTIAGRADSPDRAAQITARISRTLRAYIKELQASARIPQSKRVRVQVLSAPTGATHVQGRRPAGPLVALTVVLVLLLLAAFSSVIAEE